MPVKTAVDAPAEVIVGKTSEEVRIEGEAAHLSMIDRMRAHYKTEKRVRVKVRASHDVPVQVNGYTFVVQPNVYVDVPESIALLLEEADYI